MIIEVSIFLVLVLLWWYIEDKRSHKKCPPGPLRFPIVGNLVQLAGKHPFPSIALEQLADENGDVFSLQMGRLSAVAFNSYDSIMEIFHNNKAGITRSISAIPVIKLRQMEGQNLGIIFGNDESWQYLRRFTIRTLRDFGFGKATSMDFVINEELDKLLNQLNQLLVKTPDNVLRIDNLFDLSVINALWRLVTGVNYKLDDPKILKLLQLSNEMAQSTSFAFDLSIAFPILHRFFGEKNQRMIRDDLFQLSRETIMEHRSRNYVDDPQCFVDMFLAKIDENPESPYFNDDQLLMTILDLFQAGAETTSKSLGFSFLYMLLHENIQEKVHEELDKIIPEDARIDMTYRSRLPFCYATVLEIQRFASIIPFPPMREAGEDFQFREYTIKKGTALMLNTQAVNFSKKVWGDPETFRPSRFLQKDGQAVDTKMADNILNFGGGKRKCLGIQLAETSLFLYFTTLMRNFKIINAPGEKDPSPIPIVSTSSSPQPFTAKLIRRR